jgi:NAD(P)H-nitrite reductase large subunit
VVLAGSGPFLLPVAQQLIEAGARIVALSEATGPAEWWPLGRAVGGQWARIAEAWDYLRTIRGGAVPVRLRRKIVAARGAETVEAAVLARVDRQWRAVPGSEEVVAADAVAVGYGFLPAVELAEACGCALGWDDAAGTWTVQVDARMQTSRPGVFAAGEITGVGGAALALAEGRLAGLGAAEHAGRLTAARAETARRAASAGLPGLRRFAAALGQVFAPRPGLWEHLTGATVVCRCEEVTAGEIRARVGAGCTSPKEVKDWTRAGMGLCQGRICGAVVSRLVAEGTGAPLAAVPRATVRPPIKPVPIGVLAATEVP